MYRRMQMTLTSSSSKSILLTNLYLSSRTGSELHILELAKAFAAAGWSVTCYTLVFAHPMMGAFSESDTKVVEFGHEEDLENHYTVLYAQHHLVSDYLWTNTDITFDKVIVSSLGPQSEHERLPLLAKDADLFVYVSEETRIANAPDNPETPVFIFPNSVSDDFLKAPKRPIEAFASKPTNIAVVSNHVVPELRALADELDRGRSISYFGMEDQSVEISPSFLQSFDLVITIGRTVIAAFASRTPVYLYDVFGGEGYIAPDSVDRFARYNFSGRPSGIRRTPRELLEDIDSRYANACLYLDALHEYTAQNRSFSGAFNSLLTTIDSLDPNPHHARACSSTIRVKQQYLAEGFARMYAQSLGRAQLYYPDSRGDLSEECSVSIRYHYGTSVELRLDCPEGKFVRFDPDDSPVCCLVSPELTALNSHKRDGRGDVFLTTDPMYSIPDHTSLIKFTCNRVKIQDELACQENPSPKKNSSGLIHRLFLRR